MKILLVQSPTGRPEVPIYPLGLAYLAGQVSDQDFVGLDLSFEEDFGRRLNDVLEEHRPDVVAVSLRNIDDSSYPVTHSYVEPFSGIMTVLENWKGTVIVGGTGFSIYPQRILSMHSRIDLGIPGEGEEIFPMIIDHLENGAEVPGWDGGRLLPWVQSDLSSISPPDYTVFDVSSYPVPDSIGVQSRRGCSYGCRYCTYGYLSGRRFRTRPVGDVLNDVRSLETLGVMRFQFVDSVFNAPSDYFEELLQALEQEDPVIRWSAWIDEDITPDQLRRMRKAGAVKVDFSPDAITDRGLSMLAKRGRANQLLPVVRAARSAGLQVGVNFFNGNPGEGLMAFISKMLFMFRVRLTLGWRDTFVNIGTIRVYAHSPLAQEMLDRGMVPDDTDFFDPVFFRKRGPSDWIYRIYQRIRRHRHG